MKLSDGNELEMPPGFRFHPTDEELVLHYLCRKCAGQPISVPVIVELDLYKFDPWQLPGMALYGEKEWYFFSPRDRKYPKGSRPNRSAGKGFWKATGADKPIGRPNAVGIKKALVFYLGKAPTGIKTNWIMHEYRLANVDRSVGVGNKNNSKLDDWVLCRLYNKKGKIEKHYSSYDNLMKDVDIEDQTDNGVALNHATAQLSPPWLLPPPTSSTDVANNQWHPDTCESTAKVRVDPSGSEHELSAESTGEKDVQSESRWGEREGAFGSQMNSMDEFQWIYPLQATQMQYSNGQISPTQDMFTFMQRPF